MRGIAGSKIVFQARGKYVAEPGVAKQEWAARPVACFGEMASYAAGARAAGMVTNFGQFCCANVSYVVVDPGSWGDVEQP